MLKKIFLSLLVIFIVIQFFRPAQNISFDATGTEIETEYAVPPQVQVILKRSCYDCHSNNTVYPWYSNIQPVAWWLQNHINEGKKHLNFSVFGSYEPKKQAHKLEELIDEVKEENMPLKSYTFIHNGSVLNKEETTLLINWAATLREQIIKQHSLVK